MTSRSGFWWRLAASVLLVAAVLPEAWRLSGYRALYRASSGLRAVTTGNAPDRAVTLSWAEATAVGAARRLPGNPSPLAVAGASRLLARDPDGALAWYGRALKLEERAEIDLNVGRALMLKRDLPGAQVAFLRAGWLAPYLLEELPDVARRPLTAEVERLADLLEAGRLSAVPRAPELSGVVPAASDDR